MARRARRTRDKALADIGGAEYSEAADVEIQALNALVETIKKNIGLDTLSFETKGMFTTSVKYRGGSYKTKPVEAGEDFALTDLRLGARDQIIFCFKPIMAKEYETMEIDEAKVFGVFEGFEQMVVQSIGLRAAPRLADGSYERAYEWSDGKSHWLKMKRHEMRVAAEKVLSARAEVKKKEKARVEDDYADNPLFGSW